MRYIYYTVSIMSVIIRYNCDSIARYPFNIFPHLMFSLSHLKSVIPLEFLIDFSQFSIQIHCCSKNEDFTVLLLFSGVLVT
jgi:hypothetical protein